jgi:hypothetical protein
LQIIKPEAEGHPSEGLVAAVLFVTLIIIPDPVLGECLAGNYIWAVNDSIFHNHFLPITH